MKAIFIQRMSSSVKISLLYICVPQFSFLAQYTVKCHSTFLVLKTIRNQISIIFVAIETHIFFSNSFRM